MMRHFAILLAIFTAGCAASTKPSSSDEGFVPLFNGHDLTGWTYGTSKGNPVKAGNGYQVKDGVLYCTATDGGNLYTEKQYTDFILRLEFKLAPDSNNGVAIRAPYEGTSSYTGMEIQILDDAAPKYAKLRPTQYCGSIYDLFGAQRGHLKPTGEWNTGQITAQGRRVTVVLNGATVVDADLDAITDPAVLKKHPGLKNESGHLGFLGHGTEVQFRNIRVKQLQ